LQLFFVGLAVSPGLGAYTIERFGKYFHL
jgi:hypothetical protein